MDGFDYVGMSPFIIFSSGLTDDDTKCVDISILDDDALEENQTFNMTLTTSDPDVMLGTDLTTIAIMDNDGWY